MYLATSCAKMFQLTLLIDPITRVKDVVSTRYSVLVSRLMLWDHCDNITRMKRVKDHPIYVFVGSMSGHIEFPKNVHVSGNRDYNHSFLLIEDKVSEWITNSYKSHVAAGESIGSS